MKRSAPILATVAIVAAIAAFWLFRRATPLLVSGSCRGCNVLLITIDTLRRDRVGVYGGTAGLTPALDGLAAHGVRFDRAFSHAPMTLPAHTAILTGLTPRRHGVRNNTMYRLDAAVPTLATTLKQSGYRTGAFVAAFVLDARFGLNRGFDVYDDHLPRPAGSSFHFAERSADEVTNAAGDWIVAAPTTVGGGPWFAWVHLFDPHAPYQAPAAYRAGRSDYDAEVAYADSAIGRLLDRLRAVGQLERTLIVVTADHGESLGEHGETTHGLFAYDATIGVPLIVNGPAIGPGAAGNAVGHADIMPTVLDLAAVPAPPGLEGLALARAPSPDRPLYFEALDASLTRGWAPLRGVVQNGWKYIDLPESELYDLASDPGETRNLAGRDPHEPALRQTLLDLERDSNAAAAPAAVDSDAAARLRSLGYVGGAVPSRKGPPRVTDDPKRLVALNEQFNSALTAFDEGRAADALAAFAAILDARPHFMTARTSAATILIGEGRADEAVRVLNDAPPEQLSEPSLLLKLAAAARASGHPGAAITALEKARAADGDNLDVLQDLAVTYAAAGRQEEARLLFEAMTRRYPGTATVWYNAGLFELQSRRNEAAAALFRHAVEHEPAYGEAWQALGAALVGRDTPAALDAWRRAEPLLPGDYDLLFNLAVLSADGPRPVDAVPYLKRFIAEAPRDRYAQDIARVRQILDRLERARP